MKAGRKPSEDALFAIKHGVSRRKVTRLGGAQYLSKLDSSTLHVLLHPLEIQIKRKTLRELGMKCSPAVPNAFKPRREVWEVNRMRVAKEILESLGA